MPAMLAARPLPALADNYIWLIEDGQGRAVVVDPGEAAPVIAALDEHGLELTSILVTHHHVDHVGGIPDLLLHCAGVPVYGPHESPAACVTKPLVAGALVDVLGVVGFGQSAVRLTAGARETDIFITPGFAFRVVDTLVTNFHLPRSTLLMLVSAFAGHAHMQALYAHAVRERYRFFSYGDAMLIARGT